MEQREVTGVQQDNDKGGFARAPHGTAGEQGIMQLGLGANQNQLDGKQRRWREGAVAASLQLEPTWLIL
jgi:hypothetical protein